MTLFSFFKIKNFQESHLGPTSAAPTALLYSGTFTTPQGFWATPLEQFELLSLAAGAGALMASQFYALLPHLPLFMLLLLSLGFYNLSGLLPYGFTFSAHLVVTLFYSVSIFFGLNYLALAHRRLSYFSPSMPNDVSRGMVGGLLLLPPVLLLGPQNWLKPLLQPLLQQFHHLVEPLLPQLQLLLEGLLPLLLLMGLPALLLLILELWRRLSQLGERLVDWNNRRTTLCDQLWDRSLEARKTRALRRSDPRHWAPGLRGLRYRLGHQPLEQALLGSLPALIFFYAVPLLLLDLAAAKQGLVTVTRMLLLGSEFGSY